MKEKRFIVRKYIMAKTASEALKKDKVTLADEVWIDSDWLSKQEEFQSKTVKGF